MIDDKRKQDLQKQVDKANAIREMLRTSGWKLMEKELSDRIAVQGRVLENSTEANFRADQALLKAYRVVLELPNTFLKQGESASTMIEESK